MKLDFECGRWLPPAPRQAPKASSTSGSAAERCSCGSVSAFRVALYLPNLVGYLRIGLLLGAAAVREAQPLLCFQLCLVNMVLDGVDGYLARAFDQASAFGAVLDVLVDNAVRGLLWTWAFPGLGGLAMVMLESTVFMATHKGGGAAWKVGCFSHAPPWVQAMMANGLRTPQGAFMVAGLMGCPLWCWTRGVFPEWPLCQGSLGALFVAGRLAAACVELWILMRFFGGLLAEDVRAPGGAGGGADAVSVASTAVPPAAAADGQHRHPHTA